MLVPELNRAATSLGSGSEAQARNVRLLLNEALLILNPLVQKKPQSRLEVDLGSNSSGFT